MRLEKSLFFSSCLAVWAPIKPEKTLALNPFSNGSNYYLKVIQVGWCSTSTTQNTRTYQSNTSSGL